MSREAILRRLGGVLDKRGARAARFARVAGRLDATGRTKLRPGDREGAAVLGRFVDRLRALEVEVSELPGRGALPAAISSYLGAAGLPKRLRRGTDARLDALAWGEAPTLRVDVGAARGEDSTGLSWASAAVAETGTLVVASAPASPTTLAFLPDTHLVVVDAANVVATYEEALALLAAPPMPRVLNFITGASRTADIGGRVVMGAHGPRRLTVFLLNEP